MRITRIVAATAALLLSAGSLHAQATADCDQTLKASFNTTPCIVTQNVSITVPYLAQVQSTSITPITLSITDFNAAQRDFDGAKVSVRANFVHNVTATLGNTSNLVPANLKISNTAGSFSSGMDAAFTVVANAAATGTYTDYQTYHRLMLSWANDSPNTKSGTITFTVTAP